MPLVVLPPSSDADTETEHAPPSNSLRLVSFQSCNVIDKYNKWIQDGGTLLNNRNIGCGINSLTFLGVFSRETGQRMVNMLDSTTGHNGTSFRDMMQFVMNKRKPLPHLDINELAGYINTPTLFKKYIEWITRELDTNACVIVKMNRDIAGEDTGHSFVMSKDHTGVLFVVDPQNMSVLPTRTDADIDKLYKFAEHNKFITASIMITNGNVDWNDLNQPLSLLVDPTTVTKRRKVRASKNRQIKVSSSEIKDLTNTENDHDAPPIILDTFDKITDFNKSGMIVVRKMPDTFYMTRVRKLVDYRPVTSPFYMELIQKWKQEECTTGMACTEHALSLMSKIDHDTYVEMVQWQNIHAKGRFTKDVMELLNKATFREIQIVPFHINTVSDLTHIFSLLRDGEMSIGQFIDMHTNTIGHAMNIAVSTSGSKYLIDGSIHLKLKGISEIFELLQTNNWNFVYIPMYTETMEFRGVKRKAKTSIEGHIANYNRIGPSPLKNTTKKTTRKKPKTKTKTKPKTKVKTHPRTKRIMQNRHIDNRGSPMDVDS